MAKRAIRIRITHERLEALCTICSEMTGDFAPQNEHGHLLREYLRELHHKLQKMLERKQEKYSLSLTGTESIAFYQLWNMLDIKHDQYANVIVNSIIARLSSIAA